MAPVEQFDELLSERICNQVTRDELTIRCGSYNLGRIYNPYRLNSALDVVRQLFHTTECKTLNVWIDTWENTIRFETNSQVILRAFQLDSPFYKPDNVLDYLGKKHDYPCHYLVEPLKQGFKVSSKIGTERFKWVGMTKGHGPEWKNNILSSAKYGTVAVIITEDKVTISSFDSLRFHDYE